ncbi:hypothetical protein Mapa_007812 [Marchantia paleacea]|nr:hypothetical protein Mapa_007812 [Marchantia paleacea]
MCCLFRSFTIRPKPATGNESSGEARRGEVSFSESTPSILHVAYVESSSSFSSSCKLHDTHVRLRQSSSSLIRAVHSPSSVLSFS